MKGINEMDANKCVQTWIERNSGGEKKKNSNRAEVCRLFFDLGVDLSSRADE